MDLITKKILLLFSGILLFSHNVFATDFVFNKDLLFVSKSVDFVQKVSNELLKKTGINLYVYMANNIDEENYQKFRNNFKNKIVSPYVAIILIRDIKKIDIISSDDDLLDKKKVYWEYMVPLIPNRDIDLTPQALSAVVFNGYVETVDLIADKFNVNIEHNVAKDEKGAKAVAQLILYIMLFSMLGLASFIYFIKKRK
ncbi:sortase B protein-sorting domain-containing protein [Helicobacter sp. MIT 14-3879]|uniref:sortase B protein-sorting domain-containing protein n=1 Tax=Helicobacter sp. MIT 14-3879 TaxID=2040649 RepID=UPI000E1EC301|nr:sortase B protein-sorting domain-containing protein [Helicobacter sp. MIT 14-3879]RDU65620.1 hypothetical protein CQA44_01175 [Helicobacter sp. MIT 14-3879]